MRTLRRGGWGALAIIPLVAHLFALAILPQHRSAEELPRAEAQGTVSRSEILDRAHSWVLAHVPYDQLQLYNGYREDCSGLVSAAWGLKQPGYTTYNLPSVAYPIQKDQLAPGDILNNRDGDGNPFEAHVLIFVSWANGTHTQYNAYEENPYWGGAHYTTNIPYPFWPGYSQSYLPMRYKDLASAGGNVSAPQPHPMDWYNTNYTLNCGGVASQPFTVNVRKGEGAAPGGPQGSYESYNVKVQAVQDGDLTGNGESDTAVLLYCTPQPSNYFLQEVQIFGPDNKLLAELPQVRTLAPAGSPLPPVYVPSEFSIKGGQLLAGMMFYAPSDSHAGGPSIHRTLSWKWEGNQFVLLAPGTSNIFSTSDILALLQELALQRCQSASSSECMPGGAKISKIDPRYGVGIANGTGEHGTIYMRPSTSSTAFYPVMSIGGDVPACSQVQAAHVPTAVFQELLGQPCQNL